MPSRRYTCHAKSLWTRYVLTLLGRCMNVRTSQQALIHANTVSPCSHTLPSHFQWLDPEWKLQRGYRDGR